MATSRRSSVRGSVVKGEPGRPRSSSRDPLPPAEPVANPAAPRFVIDYALQRRGALRTLHTGGALTSEFCEADPYLLKAAKFHGETSGEKCPACRKSDLVNLHYVYGDELGPYSGRIRAESELPAMAPQFGEFTVYVVEVCQHCHWNFMIRRFQLGDGVPRRALPTPRDLIH